MPNIMLTDVCNLRCSYCFANEFVNKDANEISIENFKKALDFIATDPNEKAVGLIGGEPTIHSKFKEILKLLIEDPRFQRVTLYTNGIRINEFVDELSHPKFNLLINCNSSSDIGEGCFKRLDDNLDLFVNKRHLKERISLGINFYKPDFNYDYILKLLLKYKFDRLRFSVTVPNTVDNKNINALEYFKDFKEPILKFYKVMVENKIVPYYDCNKIPSCMFEKEDFIPYKNLIPNFNENNIFNNPNERLIVNDMVHCSPVVDIRHDLTAVRCFGLSDVTKVKISDFNDIVELRQYYYHQIDCFACNTSSSSNCLDCMKRKNGKCYGGCLAFKINDILELRSYGEEKIRRK